MVKHKWDASSDKIRRRCVHEVIVRIDELQGAQARAIITNKLEDVQVGLDLLAEK